MDPHERPVVTEENKTAVRGGATGNNVRYVVIGSVVLAIVAWILVEILRQAVNSLGHNRSSDTLESLRREAASCRACPLWKNATQTVFGEGPPDAEIMLVGEQPGDQEDLEGRPFVGPAGLLLDRALVEAGVDRASVLRDQRGQAFQV